MGGYSKQVKSDLQNSKEVYYLLSSRAVTYAPLIVDFLVPNKPVLVPSGDRLGESFFPALASPRFSCLPKQMLLCLPWTLNTEYTNPLFKSSIPFCPQNHI